MFYERKSSNMPRIVWAEESKNGLRFEIEPTYVGMTASQRGPNVHLMGNPAVPIL